MRELAAWYQKKISSYDKEEWETMVEQLLSRGIYKRRVVDLSTKIRPYLIDVDLVRGSSFPKAKPTLGVWSVMWYGMIRALFMPALYPWWRQQTSSSGVKILLLLWSLQLLNVIFYIFSPKEIEVDMYAVLVPGALMIGLSVVHAQIVSTTAQEFNRSRPRAGSKQARDTLGFQSESDREENLLKSPKFRRKVSINRGKISDEKLDDGLRKRINTPETVVDEKPPNIEVISPKPCNKAKDSDDEDYMEWKRASRKTVTPRKSKPNLDNNKLTENAIINDVPIEDDKLKLLQQEVNIVRNIEIPQRNVDFDDGFESLNGNLSNGSDNDNNRQQVKAGSSKQETPTIEINECYDYPSEECKSACNSNISETSNVSEKVTEALKVKPEKEDLDFWVKKQERRNNVPKKRNGVRFRNSWVQEMIEQVATDDSTTERSRKSNLKASREYNSSSSEAECETGSGPSMGMPSHQTMSDWVGQTTNSEECSYSSESEVSNSDVGFGNASALDPFTILNPACDTVKCTVWEHGDMIKTQLTAVDISWYVVARAEHAMASGGSYVWAGVFMAVAIALISPAATLIQVALEQDTREADESHSSSFWYLPHLVLNYSNGSALAIFKTAFGSNTWILTMNVISCFLRFAMSGLCFFLLAVAERAFKQRFLYAKLFCHLTSARRARKSELPHFRLNTVRNIKTWLSARSYLRRRGPQRSVDVIVSAAFVMTLLLLAYVSAQLLRESASLECGGLLEALMWCGCLGVWLLRLMTLGSNINKKYRGCLSALITEQINLHLAIEQRPQRKDQLTLANNVLKLAADLLKELDTPFKISGMCANHYLYTIFKVVILSAMSGVLSEMLGFKLKLHKIKIK